MDKLFQLGPRMVGGRGTGDLVTLVLEGVTKFRTYLEAIIPRMVGMSITPILVLIYIYTMDTASGIILTITMPIIIVFMILIGMTARKQMDRQLKSYRTLSNHFVDSLRGLETLKFLGRSRSHSTSIATVSDRYRSATMRTLRVAFVFVRAGLLYDVISSFRSGKSRLASGQRSDDTGYGLNHSNFGAGIFFACTIGRFGFPCYSRWEGSR